MYLHHLWKLKKLLNNTNYIYHQSVLKMKVSCRCFIASPSPIASEFCNIHFILPWVFRYFFLPFTYFIFSRLVSASYYSSFSSSTTFLSFPFFTPFLCSKTVLSWASGCHFSSSLNDIVFIIKICEREKFCLGAFNIGADTNNTAVCLKAEHGIL